MKIEVSTVYKGVKIVISDDVDSSGARAKVVNSLKYTIDNINENFGDMKSVGKVSKTSEDDPDWDDLMEKYYGEEPKQGELPQEGDSTVWEPTEGQKNYLKKLGASDKQIAGCKTKMEASALITKLTNKKAE